MPAYRAFAAPHLLALLLLLAGLCRAPVAAAAPADELQAALVTTPASIVQAPSQQLDARGSSLVWQRAMQWQRHGSTDYGLGLAVLRPATGQVAGQVAVPAGGAMPAGALALLAVGRPVAGGVSMNLGAGIPIGVQAPAWRDTAEATAPDSRGELRMGLSFSTRSATSELRRGLALHVELSGSTALTLKPRAGRVGLQLNSRW